MKEKLRLLASLMELVQAGSPEAHNSMSVHTAVVGPVVRAVGAYMPAW